VTERAIVDTGPLVAFLDRDEKHHAWTVEKIQRLEAPLLTCEPVLTEVMFLLGRVPAAQTALFRLLERGALKIGFSMDKNLSEVHALMRKYADQPMSLADACVLRMAELNERHVVFTLDSDFQIYRKHGREPVKLLSPRKK